MTALGLDSLKELLGTVPAATGAGPGGPGAAPAAGTRRAGARERGEAHRERGNAAFRARDFEGALDWYTRAINANQADPKAVCNRCAAHTALGRYREAVADAEFGLETAGGSTSHPQSRFDQQRHGQQVFGGGY